jgi:4-amino-4-deoxy-L-arabinose transferase-like glycosyltransferase
MLPFVQRAAMWQTGLAGVFPSAAAFVFGGLAMFAAARRAFLTPWAGLAAVLAYTSNPNLLYLQSIPMTESLLIASLAALLWATLWYRDERSMRALLAAAVASNAAALTRYEGWFVIPFVFVYLLITAERKWHALLFGGLALVGPLLWLAHNQFYYSNPLEFVNGPYSAAAIYKRQLAGGMAPYPGDHDWLKALQYYAAASRLAIGIPVLLIGLAGTVVSIVRRSVWPALFLLLPPAFYVWSIHSSGTPIFVPSLWPFSWYNTRYAIVVLPWAAMGAGALAASFPPRYLIAAALTVGLLPAAAYLAGTPGSICWKESQVNSEARRTWTREAAQYLADRFQSGERIAISFGDLAAVLRVAGIPIRAALHEGNHPQWDGVMAQPGKFLSEDWVVAFAGDPLASATLKADREGVRYQLRKQIMVKGAPVVEIYHREP